MVGGQDDCGFVPLVVFFDPADDHFKRVVTTQDRADRIVQVVLVVGPVDVAGFDQKPFEFFERTPNAARVISASVGFSSMSFGSLTSWYVLY